MFKGMLSLLIAVAVSINVFAANVPATNPPVDASNSMNKSTASSESADADEAMSGLNASFAEVASLGQQISLASKQIEALQMQKQLDMLKTSTSQKSLGFRIARIEGFGAVLYAVLMTDTGGIIQVGPGEKINDHYRVSLITSNSVKVVEVETGNVFTVPFNTPAGMANSGGRQSDQPKRVQGQVRSQGRTNQR